MRIILTLFFLVSVAYAENFFPRHAFSDRDDLDDFSQRWFSSQLSALEETSLYAPTIPKGIECYRFTWLRTFHHPVVFRVDVSADSSTFKIKVADGAGGYAPGKLVRNETKEFTEHALKRLRAYIRGRDFFSLPSFEENAGLDGSEWIIEVVSDAKYHIVTRWSPQDGPINQIGMIFIEYAIGGDFVPIY